MPTATRVLYAGHSEDSVTTVSESLTESLPEFSITTAIEPDTVLEAVDDDRVDCVFLETPVTEFGSNRFLDQLHSIAPELPVVLVSQINRLGDDLSEDDVEAASDVVLRTHIASRPDIVASRIENLLELQERGAKNREYGIQELRHESLIEELEVALGDDVSTSIQLINQYLQEATTSLDTVLDSVETDTEQSSLPDELATDLEDIQVLLDDAASKSNVATETISNLLTLVSNAQIGDDLVSVDLRSLADDVWAGLNTENAELSVEPNLSLRASRPALKDLLREAFCNSLEHGRTADDEITVRIGMLPDSDGIHIEDTGTGFSDDADLETVLDAPSSTDSNGFGLTIITQIADAHGWRVSAEHNVDEGGARFEFYLE